MTTIYRQPPSSPKQVTPEDEMRLILAKSNERGMAARLVIRFGLLALVAASWASGNRSGMWLVYDVALLALFAWGLTARWRLERRLRRQGYEVPRT